MLGGERIGPEDCTITLAPLILTEEWYGWLGQRDPSRPFFGFLYYDAAVAFEPPDDYPPPWCPSRQTRRPRP